MNNFGDQTRTGVLPVVWSQANSVLKYSINTKSPFYLGPKKRERLQCRPHHATKLSRHQRNRRQPTRHLEAQSPPRNNFALIEPGIAYLKFGIFTSSPDVFELVGGESTSWWQLLWWRDLFGGEMTGYREKQLAKGTSFNKFNCSAKR